MESADPYPRQSVDERAAEQGSELDVSQVQPAQIEPQDAHWLRMDPSLTRAVLAKTEEELLGSLAALMRNKVEHEQASRRFAQIQIDTEQAKRLLETIRDQIRRAEVEVATRLNEQTRISEEIIRVRVELDALRDECRLRAEMPSGLESDAIKTETERLTSGLNDLHQEIAHAAAQRQLLQKSMAEEQIHVNDLLARKQTLEHSVAEAADKQNALEAQLVALEGRQRQMTEARHKSEQSCVEEGLPLLFGLAADQIAPEWDSYPLESEFHTDEALDARKVAELVAQLPGLEGCLIVKNHGPVLASQLPERIHPHLKVPDRNYQLLFERLEHKLDDYRVLDVRLATFDLGEESLTVAQANHAFVFVNHRQNKLRPGVPGKLASIVAEVAKMYPQPAPSKDI